MTRTYRNEDNEPRKDDEFEGIKHLFEGVDDSSLARGPKRVAYYNPEMAMPDEQGITGYEWADLYSKAPQFNAGDRQLPNFAVVDGSLYKFVYPNGYVAESFWIPDIFEGKIPVHGPGYLGPGSTFEGSQEQFDLGYYDAMGGFEESVNSDGVPYRYRTLTEEEKRDGWWYAPAFLLAVIVYIIVSHLSS